MIPRSCMVGRDDDRTKYIDIFLISSGEGYTSSIWSRGGVRCSIGSARSWSRPTCSARAPPRHAERPVPKCPHQSWSRPTLVRARRFSEVGVVQLASRERRTSMPCGSTAKFLGPNLESPNSGSHRHRLVLPSYSLPGSPGQSWTTPTLVWAGCLPKVGVVQLPGS